jgi:hypothetical protein
MQNALSASNEEKPTADSIVQMLNSIGQKYKKMKSTQQRMQAISTASKSDLNAFQIVIKNIWQGEHGAFQLSEEEVKSLKSHKEFFREYLKVRTTLKRKRAILQEGTILKKLTNLMTELEVGA